MRAFPRPLAQGLAIKAAVCTPSLQKLSQRRHQGTSLEGEQRLQNTLEIAPRKASSQPGRFCPSHTPAQGSTAPSGKDTMSTESMIRDVELAEEALPKKAWGPQNSSRCLCLSLFSFLLVAGATTLFCLLNFGVIGPQREEKFPNNLPIIGSMAQTLTLRSSSQNSSDKPVAHVVANHQVDEQLEWLSRRANALLANGMDLKDNQLVIPADGLYLVYSQVLFKGQGCSNYVLLTHTVSRFAVSYEDKVNLLSAIKSPCPKETPEGSELKPWYEPIYLGGVFQLEKGDRLSAEVNLPKYLDFAESGQVYFGVIAL